MDINSFVSSNTADCVIRNPVTGEKTDIVITVHGIDSPVFRAVTTAAARDIMKQKAAGKEPEDSIVQDVERLADLTTGWTGIEENGKPFNFSRTAAIELYTKSAEIRRQVDRFIFSVSNFLPNA